MEGTKMTRQEISEETKISNPRLRIIKSLNKLPLILIEKAYTLDVIQGTLQLQYDSFLKGLYKAERIPDNPSKPGFIYFQIGPWRVIMDSEED